MTPTCFFRWVRKPLQAPARTLEQWWSLSENTTATAPGTFPGEWREIDDIGYIAEQPKETPVKDSIDTRVCLIIAEFVGVEACQVVQTTTTRDLDLDSLDRVEILMAVEDEFGIEIPDDAWADNPPTDVQGFIDITKRFVKS